MMKPTLFVMVGAPGSGKSYFAHQLRTWMDKTTIYISRDVIRMEIVRDDERYFSHEKEVYRIFIHRIADALTSGYNVIADATHLNHPSRNKLVASLQNQYNLDTDQYNIVFIVMNTSLATCIARDNERSGRAHVTETVIRDFSRNFRQPTKDEFPNVIGVWVIRE